MRLHFYLFILFGICSTIHLHAQNKFVDSLQTIINLKKTSKENQFDAYYRLAEWYRVEENYKMADGILKKHLVFAVDNKNEEEIVKAQLNQGIVYSNQEKFDKSFLILEKIKQTSNKTDFIKAYATYLEAYIKLNNNDSQNALKAFQKVASILENTHDYSLLTKTYYNLYSIFSNLNDTENTLLYTQKMIKSALLSRDKNLLSNSYTALAVAYTLKYDESKKPEDLDLIFKYSNEAIKYGDEYKNQVGSRTYAIAKLNLASYYLRYHPKEINIIKDKTKEALAASKVAVGNEIVLASCYGILSQIAQTENNMNAAENYLLDAYNILKDQKPIYYYSIIMVSSDLSALYEKMGLYQKALQFQKLTTEYNLALYSEEEATTIKKIEAQYQFNKKEKEVSTLIERSESQRKQKLLYAGLGIIALIGSFFMFRSYHYRLKYSLQKEKKLEAENHEAELLIKLQEEEQNRLKAEKELSLLKQQKLQDEILATQLHIQHKNNVLHQLKTKLEDDTSVNINKIIKEENIFDSDFEKTKFEIQEIHPNFFHVINQKAVQKLTTLDAKYCAYIYLGMETKQIANLLNVEPKSVRMTKYRLKQKFSLDSETDLVHFIKSLPLT